MKTRAMLARHAYGKLCRLIASLLAAYLRMQGHVGIVAVSGLCSSHVGIDYAGVLTMCHDGDTGFAEYTFESLTAINEHVAR